MKFYNMKTNSLNRFLLILILVTVVFFYLMSVNCGKDPVSDGNKDTIYELSLVGISDTFFGIKDISISGDYAYLGGILTPSGPVKDFQVLDISDPTKPIQTGVVSTYRVNGIDISGNFAYLANDYTDLKIIDISDPNNPILTGSCYTFGRSNDVFISDTLAYVTNIEQGLQIINIADSSNPVYISSFDSLNVAWEVFVSDDYAYVTDMNKLLILDITDIYNIKYVSSYISRNAASIYVLDDYAYLVDYCDGLKILNICDPVNPLLIGSYDIENAFGITVYGDYAYVNYQDGYPLNSGGFQVIDISNPLEPEFVLSHESPHATRKIVATDKYIYVSDYDVFIIFELITRLE